MPVPGGTAADCREARSRGGTRSSRDHRTIAVVRLKDRTGAPAATLRRGHAKPRRSVGVSSRWGWGPSASAKAPAATLSRGQATPRLGVSVSSRWGWGPSASAEKSFCCWRTPMPHSVLVTRKLPSSVIKKLQAEADVDVHSGDEGMPAAQLRARVADKNALVSLLTDAIDRSVIDAAPNLKVVANVAVGYNNIDVEYARSRGVLVTHTPDVLTEAVADFTWALILAITRRLAEGERLLRRGDWKGWALDFMLGTELRGKQLGLVGVGRIGG